MKVHLTNHIPNHASEKWLSVLHKPIFCISCKDSAQDVHTQVSAVLLTDFYIHLYYLHIQLEICEGAKVMLTYNMNLEDCVINGSTETIVYFQIPCASDSLHVTINVKFDDPGARKSHKNPHFAREDLQDCVSIVATMKTFSYYHKNCLITVHRKQFPFKLGFVITFHNPQGATSEYMKVNFDCTLQAGKGDTVPINQGAAYTVVQKVVQNFNY